MFKQFFSTFTRLFTTPGGRLLMAAMILLMALITFAELVVMHQFFGLIGDGACIANNTGANKCHGVDESGVIRSAAIFFVLFMVTRGIHHWSRFFRVTAVKKGFAASERQAGAAAAAWEWSLAFELSICFAAIAQAIITCFVFVLLVSPTVGLANVVIASVVLVIIALIYDRNLGQQLAYTEVKPTQDEVGTRLKQRLWDAEWGMAISSVAMALALAFTLYETMKGRVEAHNALFAFIGSRMLYGQLSQLSGSAMRFGRAIARRGPAGFDPTHDDDLADLDQPADPGAARRMNIVSQMLIDGQSGRLEQVRDGSRRLSMGTQLSDDERNAEQAAEAFAHYANGSGEVSLGLLWNPRPFPGIATDWLNPLLLNHFSGMPVSYTNPQTAADYPHLAMSGRLVRELTDESICVGFGAMPRNELPARATYISARGPLTAALVSGHAPTRFGEPLALASRALPLRRKDTNGRIALVRHPEHLKIALKLSAEMDEVSLLASRPDAIRALLTSLLAYEGVLTTSLQVLALCDSFGIPAAPIGFKEPIEGQLFAYEDYARGLEIPVTQPVKVGTDLGMLDPDDLLRAVALDPALLDDIEEAIGTGVGYYVEQLNDLAGVGDEAAELT